MSDARDLFLNSMDCDRQSGIHATLSRLEASLERCDPELCANLVIFTQEMMMVLTREGGI